jgi:hypothetical protein
MAVDPEDNEQDIKPGSHWLLWLIVCVFLLLSIAGMWSIDYFFSPEAMAAHKIRDAVDD